MPKPGAVTAAVPDAFAGVGESSNGNEKKRGRPKKTPKPSTVKYPELRIEQRDNDEAITSDYAKELLGWTEEGEGDDWGDEYLLKDEYGKKIRCLNNDLNRPFDEKWARTLAQTVLTKHWAGPRGNGESINGETIIIGKTGKVLSGQHRLIALILAEQLWKKYNDHWAANWPDEPVMESYVSFGTSEDKETNRTRDNVKQRTLADVLFTDYDKFHGKGFGTYDRVKLCRMTSFALKLLWARTGVKKDPYSGAMSHTQALDFLDRHKGVLDCVLHIYNLEGKDGKVTQYCSSMGTAAGLMYLFATSKTDPDLYHESDPPREGSEKKPIVNFDHMESAKDFWTGLANDIPQFSQLKAELGRIKDPLYGAGGGQNETISLLCKAWNNFVSEKPFTKANLKLKYGELPNGGKKLEDFPDVGGIDLGPVSQQTVKTVEEVPSEDKPEILESLKKKERDKREAEEAKAEKQRQKKKAEVHERLQKERKSKKQKTLLTVPPTVDEDEDMPVEEYDPGPSDEDE